MKKYFLLALLLAFMTVGAFALDVGGGLMFGSGSRTYDYYDYHGYELKYTSTDFGLTGFLGWKYFDFTVGLSLITASKGASYNYAVFHAGFDFKIPFTVSNMIRFYPMLGFDMAFGDKFNTSGWHMGMGADVLLFDNMFVRGNVLYAFHSDNHHDTNGTIESAGGGVLIRACAGWRF